VSLLVSLSFYFIIFELSYQPLNMMILRLLSAGVIFLFAKIFETDLKNDLSHWV
jgi:membrane-bound ClpP family serine protease